MQQHENGGKNAYLTKMQILAFCKIMSKIGENENLQILSLLLQFKEKLENGKRLSPMIMDRMQLLFEDGDSARYAKNLEKLRLRLREAIELREHIDFGNFLTYWLLIYEFIY
jgi:hypothetical protein